VIERDEPVAGYYAPVDRAVTEPILLGGAPRAVAIVNGTLAAAIGLGLRLWIAGGALWQIGHLAAVWPPSATRRSSRSCAGTCATRSTWSREAGDDESCRIPPPRAVPRRFPALGRIGR
jgi:type IV secretory pathway TrbD component